jgi:hypothetical protein
LPSLTDSADDVRQAREQRICEPTPEGKGKALRRLHVVALLVVAPLVGLAPAALAAVRITKIAFNPPGNDLPISNQPRAADSRQNPTPKPGDRRIIRSRRPATADWVVDRIRASGELARTVEAELFQLDAWANMR